MVSKQTADSAMVKLQKLQSLKKQVGN